MPIATEYDYIVHIPEGVTGVYNDIRSILARVLVDTDRYDWSKEHRVFALNVEGLPEAVGGIYGLLTEARMFERGVDFKPAQQWSPQIAVERGTGRAVVDPTTAAEPSPATPGALALTAILVDDDGEIEVGDAHVAPEAAEPRGPVFASFSPIARVEENRAALRPVLQGACTLSLHAEDGTRREVIVAPTRDRHWIATLVERGGTGTEVADADHVYRLHAKLLALYTPASDEPHASVV